MTRLAFARFLARELLSALAVSAFCAAVIVFAIVSGA